MHRARILLLAAPYIISQQMLNNYFLNIPIIEIYRRYKLLNLRFQYWYSSLSQERFISISMYFLFSRKGFIMLKKTPVKIISNKINPEININGISDCISCVYSILVHQRHQSGTHNSNLCTSCIAKRINFAV